MVNLNGSTTTKPQSVMISEYIKFIITNPIFSKLNYDELENISSAIVRLRFKKGEIIEKEAEPSSMFYIIESGVVFSYKTSPSGQDFIIDVRIKGESFASLAALSSLPYFASARAAEDTILLALKRDDFIAFFSRDPNIITKVVQNEAAKLFSAYTKLIDLAWSTAKGRILKILLMLSSKFGNELNYTHLEIADMSCTTLETVTRHLSYLKRKGVIDSRRGKVIIVNEAILRSMI